MTPGTTEIMRQQVKPEDNNYFVHTSTVRLFSSRSSRPALVNVPCESSKFKGHPMPPSPSITLNELITDRQKQEEEKGGDGDRLEGRRKDKGERSLFNLHWKRTCLRELNL